WVEQIANDFLGIRGIEFIDHSQSHAHGQLRPRSFNRVASEKDDFQVRKMVDDSFDNLIGESRVSWRDVTREKRTLMREQPAVTVEVEIKTATQLVHILQKRGVAPISASRWMEALRFT